MRTQRYGELNTSRSQNYLDLRNGQFDDFGGESNHSGDLYYDNEIRMMQTNNNYLMTTETDQDNIQIMSNNFFSNQALSNIHQQKPGHRQHHMATEKDSRGEYLQLQQHKVKFQTQSNFAKQKRSLNQRSQVQLIT